MLGVVLALALAAQPSGQPASPGLARLDGSKPVDVSAARCEVLKTEDTVECTGEVRVSQGEAILTGDRLKIFGTSATGGFRRIEGEGNIRYGNGIDAISGSTATYDAASSTIVVTGDVIVVQGPQVMTGGKLTYNTTTGAIAFQPGADGRVRGLFYTASTSN